MNGGEIFYSPAGAVVEDAPIPSTKDANLGHITGLACDTLLRRLYICASDLGQIYYVDLETNTTHVCTLIANFQKLGLFKPFESLLPSDTYYCFCLFVLLVICWRFSCTRPTLSTTIGFKVYPAPKRCC